MTISRDEAREIAIVAILGALALRVGSGVVQAIEELGGAWTLRSVLSRLLAPIGSTVGILTLAAAMLAVLSPTGSVSRTTIELCRRVSAGVFGLGVGASFFTLAFGYPDLLSRIWYAMINGLSTVVLGGGAFWILRHFDGDR